RSFSGRPARALRNRVTEEVEAVLPYPAQMSLTAPLRQAAPDGEPGAFLPLWSGQAAPLAVAAPAGEVVASISAGADRALREPGG
ncbi:MAG: nitronate monooxygenase, partial [Thermoleophilaceae bacterium]